MKRQITNLGTFVVILSTFMLLAVQGATYGQTVSIDPASVESPAAGEQLTLNIKITGGMNVAGYQATVTFDSTALSYVSSANGDYLPSGAFVVPTTITDTSAGLAAVTIRTGTGVPAAEGDGTLATVTFTVVEAKDSTIGLTDVLISDPDAAAIVVTIQGGMVTASTPEMPETPEIPEMPEGVEFKVTLTNLTMGVPAEGGQIFSPPIFVTHGHGFSIGASGEAASAQLTALAETGNHQPLAELAGGSDAVGSIVAFPAPPEGVVLPGASVSTMISANAGMGYLSLATMLVQTNDGIVLGNSLPLFDEDGNARSFTMDLISYDAGTEDNNELATHVPGPPFGGMERAPTEGGVISPHPGIAGSADVGAAFGWTEPTASVTVTPITAPEIPVEPKPPVEVMHMFEMALASGLNMISLPLMPAEPYTASSFTAAIGATIVIQLDTAMQEFVGFTADQEGDGFPIEGGKGYIVNVPGGGMVTFTGTAWNNAAEEEAAAAPSIQLPTAWAFVVSGDLLETEAGVSYTVVATNHRTGEITTRQVSSDHKEFNAVWADLSRKSVIEAGDTLEITLMDQGGNIVSGPFTHKVGTEDLRKAYLSLALTVGDVHPASTILGQNFPNPFNPETWIPYQLEKSADVVLQIYDASGGVVRSLDLGFKPQGFYMTRSTAAYWDGRNNMGEQVASGVYFYSLQTSDFSATRKMLILK